MRPLYAFLIIATAAYSGAGENDSGADVAGEDSASGGQMAPVWTPEPGWQLVLDHPVDPDLVVVGIFGERWIDPDAPASPRTSGFPDDPNKKRDRRIDTANMPRLVLSCENGVTAATIERPLKALEPVQYRPTRRPRSDSSFASEESGVIVLIFDDSERIDIDLDKTPRRIDPVYMPDPFDTIQRLLRRETLYYFEITQGEVIYVPFSGDALGTFPDAVFYLEGLGELLDNTRDPCGWGAD